MTLRLEQDGLDPFDLDAADSGVVIEVFDLGSPQVREVTQSRPGADGEIDETRFSGGRALTLGGSVSATAERTIQQTLDRINAFRLPKYRPWLYYSVDDGTVRRIQVRAADDSAPIVDGDTRELSLGWKCPKSFVEADEATTVLIRPPSTGSGLTMPFSFPFSLGGGGDTPTDVRNDGNAPADWVARIFGACEDPQLINTRTGDVVGFNGLTIAAGDYVEIDSTRHTVLAGGLAGASRHHLLDLSTLAWWQLDPGSNPVQLLATDPDSAAVAELVYRHTWR